MSLACLLAAAGFLLGLGRPAWAEASGEQTLLVQFAPELSVEARDARIAQMGAVLVNWMPQIHVAEVRLPAQEGMVVAAALPTADGAVTFAEADMVVAPAYTPTDPDWGDATMRYGLEQVQVPQAWDIVTGTQRVVIAVVDSGVNLDHPEFAGRLVSGANFINPNELPYDETGHGTHVAGIIAAGIDNGVGVAGVCPNCRIMPVKVLNASNLGSWSTLAQGILYAVDQGAQIINISVGATARSDTLAAAVQYAVGRGVVVVAAAGNLNNDIPYYPAAFDGVIAVTATDAADVRWERSNFGAFVDLAAPGNLIYSTFHQMDNLFGGYTYMSGTSMAAPFVAGTAGLLLSMEPALPAAQVTEALIWGADDLGPAGWDPKYGYGRINAYRTLHAPVVQAVGEVVAPHTLYLPALTAHP